MEVGVTAIILMITLLVIPVLIYIFGEKPNSVQKSVMTSTGIVYCIVAAFCFIVSFVADNYSQVDKLWSIMPIIYAWMVAFQGSLEPRLILVAVLISIWGIRLTLNFARRGGYSIKFWEGDEDYRWSVLRQRPEFNAKWKWQLFNLFFISYYQMGLVLLITFPMIKSIGGRSLGIADYIMAAISVFILVIETIADQQQWAYQEEKHKLIKENQPLTGIFEKGFTHTGLWSVSRHPNYAAEQLFWVTVYLFSIIASGQWFNWSIAGAILLIILFKGSSDFSEAITEKKYPQYEEYKKNVSRFIPFIY